ncbi:hypothetical protein RB195_004013 [Necator americanus]|uniref:Reverse transcriptase domain-containing protein n=1 Tax=Necator americanus TaxID=51031 RepID=A0ABR1DRH7_NECAM
MPLCLTFIDLKKVFDSVETETVMEALNNQGVPTQYIKPATLEKAVRKLEWDDMEVKVDDRQLHHLRFADDIVLIKPSTSQVERILTEFDETCRCSGLQLNLQNYAKRMGLGCPIHAQRDEHIRMHQAGGDERLAECSEEDQEHLTPFSPLQHHRTSCSDLCFGNLGISQAGRKRGER